MLLPPLLSPRIDSFCSPSLFFIQPSQSSKRRNSSKRGSFSYESTTGFPCVTIKNPSSSTHFLEIWSFSDSGKYPCTQKISKSLPFVQLIKPDELGLWLQSCYSKKDVRRIHAVVVKCLGSTSVYVCNNVISAYLRFGKLVEARKVFDRMRKRNVVTWTALFNGYLRLGLDDEAFLLFKCFVEGGGQANGKTFVCALNLCCKRLDLVLGKQIHALVVKGNWRHLIVDSATVYFYSQCGDLSDAFRAFDQMTERDVVCWTALITACSQQSHGREAFSMFLQMLCDGFSPNEFTVSSILKACGDEKALEFGKQLHGILVKKIFKDDVFIGSALVDMYAKCGKMLDCREVFDGMAKTNTVTWTSIIAGYARNGLGEEALNLFRVMKRRNIFANDLTIVSILMACGSVEALLTGKEVHAQIIKNSIQSNMYIGSTLVWFYCKCVDESSASKVLQTMPFRDVVSWTAIISGCARLGHESEALAFLKEMLNEGVEPNSYTYSSALKACAKLGAILQGKLIHSSVNKNPSLYDVYVGSALINMYAKCGYVSEAIQVFDILPERNLVSWKAMIVGYARNGFCREALKLMYRMQAEGIKVDDYILSTVLTACVDVSWTMDPSSELSSHSNSSFSLSDCQLEG